VQAGRQGKVDLPRFLGDKRSCAIIQGCRLRQVNQPGFVEISEFDVEVMLVCFSDSKGAIVCVESAKTNAHTG
jgi:hypothetical protein